MKRRQQPPAGIEPATANLGISRSVQLSYGGESEIIRSYSPAHFGTSAAQSCGIWLFISLCCRAVIRHFGKTAAATSAALANISVGFGADFIIRRRVGSAIVGIRSAGFSLSSAMIACGVHPAKQCTGAARTPPKPSSLPAAQCQTRRFGIEAQWRVTQAPHPLLFSPRRRFLRGLRYCCSFSTTSTQFGSSCHEVRRANDSSPWRDISPGYSGGVRGRPDRNRFFHHSQRRTIRVKSGRSRETPPRGWTGGDLRWDAADALSRSVERAKT